jgi:REP element-mobilizing transposase RayT
MPYSELRKGRHSEPGHYYLITPTTADREPWFEQLETASSVVAEMKRLHDESAVQSLAWVLMPYHLHWLFVLGERLTLAQVLNALKGRSARSINRHLCRTGPIWQSAYHDHALRSDENLRAVARYIVANPLRAGLVTKLGGYPHWDAAWLDP